MRPGEAHPNKTRRISDELWAAAVQVCRQHSVHKVSPTLRLSCSDLRAQIEPAPCAPSNVRFVELKITFIGHASIVFTFGGKTIHVDPDGHLTDYTRLPKADLVLITHEHKDHCDPKALEAIATDKTIVVTNEPCAVQMKNRLVMHNGDTKTVEGLQIQAVPAYNLIHMRSEGVPFHPKGVGNGYVISFGDKRVYIAGDTENIPEMKALERIEIAFLPMNLPYTMTPEMVAAAAKSFNPKILYPYHFGETDTSTVVELLRATNIQVRIRKMK